MSVPATWSASSAYELNPTPINTPQSTSRETRHRESITPVSVVHGRTPAPIVEYT